MNDVTEEELQAAFDALLSVIARLWQDHEKLKKEVVELRETIVIVSVPR